MQHIAAITQQTETKKDKTIQKRTEYLCIKYLQIQTTSVFGRHMLFRKNLLTHTAPFI